MNKDLMRNFRCWLTATVFRRSPPALIPMHFRLWQSIRQSMKTIFYVDRTWPRSNKDDPIIYRQRVNGRALDGALYLQHANGEPLDRTLKMGNVSGGPIIMSKSTFLAMRSHNDLMIKSRRSTKKPASENIGKKDNDKNKEKEPIKNDMRYSQCQLPSILCRQRGALNGRAAYMRRLSTNGIDNFTS